MIVSETMPGSEACIETATWRDLSALRYLEKECFPKDAWPLWDLVGVLTLPNIVRLKATLDGQMVGFLAGDYHPGDSVAWIATVAVLPAYQRRGIGTALILACEKQIHAPSLRLSVRMSNASAIKLYQDLGYQKIGVWSAYYTDQEDALVMEKTF